MTRNLTAAAIAAITLAFAPAVHAEGTTVRAAETMSQMKPCRLPMPCAGLPEFLFASNAR